MAKGLKGMAKDMISRMATIIRATIKVKAMIKARVMTITITIDADV
jgi:hypothetical protein